MAGQTADLEDEFEEEYEDESEEFFPGLGGVVNAIGGLLGEEEGGAG
jgi:hypothetical protein